MESSTQFSSDWQGQGSYEGPGWKEGFSNTGSERMGNDQFAPPPIPPPPPSLKRSSVRDTLQASQANPLAIADRRRSVAVVKKTEERRDEGKEEIRQEDRDGGSDEGKEGRGGKGGEGVYSNLNTYRIFPVYLSIFLVIFLVFIF